MPSKIAYKKWFRRVLHIKDTPESIALGVTLGTLIAITPTVGIQMLLVILFGTLIGANRLAGIVMVYISNPFTLIPIYWLDYAVGTRLLGMQPIAREAFETAVLGSVDRLMKLEVWAAVQMLWTGNTQILWPTLVGGTLLGFLVAIPVYPITLRAVRAAQRLRAHKLALQQLRAARRREREELRAGGQEEKPRRANAIR